MPRLRYRAPSNKSHLSLSNIVVHRLTRKGLYAVEKLELRAVSHFFLDKFMGIWHEKKIHKPPVLPFSRNCTSPPSEKRCTFVHCWEESREEETRESRTSGRLCTQDTESFIFPATFPIIRDGRFHSWWFQREMKKGGPLKSGVASFFDRN